MEEITLIYLENTDNYDDYSKLLVLWLHGDRQTKKKTPSLSPLFFALMYSFDFVKKKLLYWREEHKKSGVLIPFLLPIDIWVGLFLKKSHNVFAFVLHLHTYNYEVSVK